MRTYLVLQAKARAWRADPEVKEAMAAAGVPDLSRPTLAPGETLADLLSDRSAYEDFDAEAAGNRPTNIERLDQLALDHIFGVR
jgi:xylose isomerase